MSLIGLWLGHATGVHFETLAAMVGGLISLASPVTS